jgi:hypothetical protein
VDCGRIQQEIDDTDLRLERRARPVYYPDRESDAATTGTKPVYTRSVTRPAHRAGFGVRRAPLLLRKQQQFQVMQTMQSGQPSRVIYYALILACCAVAAGLRIAAVGVEGFWLDEIFSASYVNLSLPENVVAILRFDVHPPLYHLQLKVWSLMFGNTDAGLIANSVFWSLATLLAMFVGARRSFGDAAAVAALAVCAVLGSEIFYAGELRMYSLISFLTVLGWIAAQRVVENYRLATAWPLLLVLALLGAVHAVAFVPISAVLVYLFPWGPKDKVRQFAPVWLAISMLVVLLISPWLANASFRSVGHTAAATPELVIKTLGGWLLGYGAAPLPAWAKPVSAALVVTLVAGGLMLRNGLARLVGSFIVWPVVFGAVVSLVVRPIWIDRGFAFCAPFVAIAVGAMWARLQPQGSRQWHAATVAACGAAALAVAMLAGIALMQSQVPRKMEYREAAAYLRDHARPGDVIQIPNRATFWGIARYLGNPNWGSMLRIQNDPADLSETWERIYARLGPEWLRRFGLAPTTRLLEGYPWPIFIGTSRVAEAATAPRVWVVSALGLSASDPANMDICPSPDIDRFPFKGVVVFRITCH